MAFVDDVNKAIAEAMRGHESIRLGALRMLKAALTNREIERGRADHDVFPGLEIENVEAVVSVIGLGERRDRKGELPAVGRPGCALELPAVAGRLALEQRLTEQVAELKRDYEQLRAERDQARAEMAGLRTSRDQLVAERVEAHAQLALAQEEITRLQKQVEQLQAKASVTGSVRAPTPSGNLERSPARPQRTRR